MFNDSTIQRINSSTIQRFNDSTVQRFNGSTVQRFNGSTIQRFNDSTVQRFNGSTIQRFNNSTVQQFNGSTSSPPPYHIDTRRNEEIIEQTQFTIPIIPLLVDFYEKAEYNHGSAKIGRLLLRLHA